MSNNRVWLVDEGSGERVLLAKANGLGWQLWDAEALRAFLSNQHRDPMGSCGGSSSLNLEFECPRAGGEQAP